MTTPAPESQGQRKHRRIGYYLRMRRPFRHSEDADLIEGLYRDPEGDLLGRLFMREGRPESGPFLVVPDESIPLVHVEAAFEADHRVESYEQVVGLFFERGEEVPERIRETGERWDDGEWVLYAFETDEDALDIQA